jgi:hypothetical protein
MSESARLEPDMTTLKSQILKSQIVVILLCLAGSAGAQRWSDQTFAGSVATGYYQAVSGIWAAYTNTGTMTNGVRTNYYRLCGTNPAGRIPLSSNAVFSFTGSTNTNALVLAWTRAPGVNAHVIERSYDLGITWTNWTTVGATITNWTDYGTNLWTATVFTNVFGAIPAGTYPWTAYTTDVAALAQEVVNVSGRVDVVSGLVVTATTIAQGAADSGAVTRVIAQGAADTGGVALAQIASESNRLTATRNNPKYVTTEASSELGGEVIVNPLYFWSHNNQLDLQPWIGDSILYTLFALQFGSLFSAYVNTPNYYFDDQAGIIPLASYNQGWRNPGYDNRIGSDPYALQFDAANDGIDLSTNAAWVFGDFTISCWVYPTETTALSTIFAGLNDIWFGLSINVPSIGHRPGIWASSNGSGWDILQCDGPGANQGYNPDGPEMTGAAWNHLVFMRTGDVWMSWVNGVSNWFTTRSGTLVDQPLTKRIGYWGDGWGRWMNGRLDEFALWHRGLSDAERAILSNNYYVTTASGPGTDAVCIIHFDEGSGASISSVVGGITGTFVSEPTWVTGIVPTVPYPTNMAIRTTNTVCGIVPAYGRGMLYTRGITSTNQFRFDVSRNYGTNFATASNWTVQTVTTGTQTGQFWSCDVTLTNQPRASNVVAHFYVTNGAPYVKILGWAIGMAE